MDDGDEPNPETSTKAPLIRGFDWLFQHRWMTGLGTAAGIAALVVALRPAQEPSPEAVESSIVVTGTVGDCAAIGSQARTRCVFPPETKQIGSVEVGSIAGTTYVHDGPPESLPTPPPFSGENRLGHCDEWADWLSSTSTLYVTTPDLHLGMVAGKNDVVVLRGANVKVFERHPVSSPSTVLACAYGSNVVDGSYITVDVGTGETWLEAMKATKTDVTILPPTRMPPAALELSGAGYESAVLQIESTPGYLYSGQILIDTLVNGEEKTISVGSPERPYRWIKGGSPGGSTEQYGWDPQSEAWVAGYWPL